MTKRKVPTLKAGFSIITGIWLAWSWMMMIMIGIMHDSWWHLIPPMGYGLALTLNGMWLLSACAVQVLSSYLKGEL